MECKINSRCINLLSLPIDRLPQQRVRLYWFSFRTNIVFHINFCILFLLIYTLYKQKLLIVHTRIQYETGKLKTLLFDIGAKSHTVSFNLYLLPECIFQLCSVLFRNTIVIDRRYCFYTTIDQNKYNNCWKIFIDYVAAVYKFQLNQQNKLK